MMRTILLLLCLTLMAGTCNDTKDLVKLSGVKWNLQMLKGKEIQLKDKNSEVFIQFDESQKRVNGRAGCNRFFCDYEFDGDKLKLSPIGLTRMACPDLETEQKFCEVLEKVNGVSIENNKLMLLQNGNVLAVFILATEPVAHQ